MRGGEAQSKLARTDGRTPKVHGTRHLHVQENQRTDPGGTTLCGIAAFGLRSESHRFGVSPSTGTPNRNKCRLP